METGYKPMSKVNFKDLDGENKLTAIEQMYNLSRTYNWPGNVWWDSEESIKVSLEQDYKPDEYYSFYIDDFGEVHTKIG